MKLLGMMHKKNLLEVKLEFPLLLEQLTNPVV